MKMPWIYILHCVQYFKEQRWCLTVPGSEIPGPWHGTDWQSVISLSLQSPGFNPRPMHVGFLANKVILRQFLGGNTSVFPVAVVPLMLHVRFMYHRHYIPSR
jgi:hypothetical protein